MNFLCNLPSLLKFKSWVPNLSGTNINNNNLFVVESLNNVNKNFTGRRNICIFFVLNIINEFDLVTIS
jgi:hypothetical protein